MSAGNGLVEGTGAGAEQTDEAQAHSDGAAGAGARQTLACGRHIGVLVGAGRSQAADAGGERLTLADLGTPLASLRRDDLTDDPTGARLGMSHGRDLFDDGTLGLLTPGSSGCGIASCPLLVPESITIFMTPRSCSRHASTLSIRDRYRPQIFFLDISEQDVVMGTYTDRLVEAADRIMGLLPEKPRAVFVCGSCIDDLLGTDMRGLCEELSGIHGMPFSWLYIDPIARSSTPPPIRMKKAIFRLLCEERTPVVPDPTAVNLIGEFALLSRDCELPGMLAAAGFKHVRQVATCATYDDFLQMRNACANVAVMRMARGAAQDMQRKLGIPFQVMRTSTVPQTMAARYDELGAFLGVQLDYTAELERIEADVLAAREKLAGVRVAVTQRGGRESLEAALMLARAGADVHAVVSDEVEEDAWPILEELRQLAPDALLLPSMRPEVLAGLEPGEGVDVALGMDAGLLFPQAKLAMFAHDGEPVGFAETRVLLNDAVRALEHGKTALEICRHGEPVGRRRAAPAWPPSACAAAARKGDAAGKEA